jgi:hypothetical protein
VSHNPLSCIGIVARSELWIGQRASSHGTTSSTCTPTQARNAALGANQALPYTVCAPTVFGNDADFIMTEINSMMGSSSGAREALARNVFDPHQFPRRPFVLNLQSATSAFTHLPPAHLTSAAFTGERL